VRLIEQMVAKHVQQRSNRNGGTEQVRSLGEGRTDQESRVRSSEDCEFFSCGAAAFD
jgi:hypothetical protein